jgi:hypothetical protein
VARWYYYEGKRTALQPGDILHYYPINEVLVVYRNEIRLFVGSSADKLDDKIEMKNTTDLIGFVDHVRMHTGLCTEIYERNSSGVVVKLLLKRC